MIKHAKQRAMILKMIIMERNEAAKGRKYYGNH